MRKYRSSEWSDDILLDLIRKYDDYLAYSVLFRRYWQPLMTAAGKWVASIEVAKELVQDVFSSFFIRRRELQIDTAVEIKF